MSRPPRLAERILSALLPADEREEILGDLAETYARRAERRPAAARIWYASQVLLVPAWLVGGGIRSLRVEPADVRRAFRGLRRSPGFAMVAVLSLGFGVGATTTIAGALQSLLFITLPVERPDELSLVYHTWPERWRGSQVGSSQHQDPRDGHSVASNVSYPIYRLVREELGEEIDLAAYAFVRELSVVAGDAPAVAAGGMLVSGNYFRTLRLTTALGRPLTDGDDQPGARTAVLSHSFWLRAFGGDPEIVGREVLLNGYPFRIVGVAQKDYVGLSPGGFFGPSDVIVPLAENEPFVDLYLDEGETPLTSTHRHWIRLIARVPDPASLESPRRRIDTAARIDLAAAGIIDASVAADFEFRFLEGRRGLDSLRSDTEGPLRILTAVVLLVLLIACANLTTLLLARGEARKPEMALRRAIGASRWELARPQLLESLLLGALGAAIGLASSLWAGPLLVAALTGRVGNAAVSYRIDWLLVTTAALAGIVAAVLSGWMPALRMMRTDPARGLGPRGDGRTARLRMGRFLIAVQIAVAIPLVVGAGLFLRTLGNIASLDPGFDPEGLVVFSVDPGHATRDLDEQARIYAGILDELRALDAVESAALVENVLVSGWMSNTRVTVDGERHMMDMNAVSSDFTGAMGIEIVSGRGLLPSDDANAPRVVLVNETAQRTLFGGRAVGRRFENDGESMEVVGVVRDTKYAQLKDEVTPGFLQPWTQRDGGLGRANFVVRTGRAPAELEPTIRLLVAEADARLPVTRFRAQGDEVRAQANRERILARLLTAFGAFALLLACIGLHGIMSFAVAQRRSEMGVRLALGAAPAGIVRMVLAQVLRLTAAGLAVGLLAAWRVGPVVDSMLYGIESTDAATMFAAAAVMAGVALAAGFLPAWKASRVDPLKSLAPSGGG